MMALLYPALALSRTVAKTGEHYDMQPEPQPEATAALGGALHSRL